MDEEVLSEMTFSLFTYYYFYLLYCLQDNLYLLIITYVYLTYVYTGQSYQGFGAEEASPSLLIILMTILYLPIIYIIPLRY